MTVGIQVVDTTPVINKQWLITLEYCFKNNAAVCKVML